MTINDVKHKIVHLDVGGMKYKVSRDTLERCEGSILASMVSGNCIDGHADEEVIFVDRDEAHIVVFPDDAVIFIDRNGSLFGYVLQYLRTDKVYLPPSTSRVALKEELEYYGIKADMSKVHEKYGVEYTHALTAKLNALQTEKRAIEASALAELNFLKQNSPGTRLCVTLPYDEYLTLHSHQDVLLECLLARGLECVSFNINCAYKTLSVTVKKAS